MAFVYWVLSRVIWITAAAFSIVFPLEKSVDCHRHVMHVKAMITQVCTICRYNVLASPQNGLKYGENVLMCFFGWKCFKILCLTILKSIRHRRVSVEQAAPWSMTYVCLSEYRIQNTESLLSTLIVTDHQCYRAIKSLQATVHSNTIDTYNTGPRITNVITTRRKNLSQWECSFLWKLRCQSWPKLPRRVAKTPATQDPGAHVTNAKRPLTKSPQQKARPWLADAKASPNHGQAPRQKLPAKSP